jgi:hypothetical protein
MYSEGEVPHFFWYVTECSLMWDVTACVSIGRCLKSVIVMLTAVIISYLTLLSRITAIDGDVTLNHFTRLVLV